MAPLSDPLSEGRSLQCPYCGEEVEVTVELATDQTQEYVEDCPVCCRPWTVSVARGEDDEVEVFLGRSDE
jgi:uncharacterized Zn finger protein